MSTPLVLLHPLGADRTFWDELGTALGPGLGERTVALDLLGHGTAAELPAGAGLAALVEDVLDQLPGEAPVDLLGISLGGLVAQQLAAERPDRVRRLVLADTVATYPEPMRTMWAERAARVRSEGTGALVDVTTEIWFTADFAQQRGPAVHRAARVLRATDDESYARTCELLRDADTTSLLPAISAPTLALCGEDDGPAFRAAVEVFQSAIHGTEVLWLAGRHAAVLESPVAFGTALRSFLNEPEPVQVHGGASA